MPRRIDVELTSARHDGSWTWRAAGAREPKGVVDGSLLPGEAKVGDVFRAEVDINLDGISVTQVAPPREARADPERLTLIGPSEPESLVSTSLVPGRGRSEGRRSGGGRGTERRGRSRDRAEPRRERRPPGERSDRGEQERRPGRPERDRRPTREPRPSRPAAAARPSPKRLRPGRTHRKAVLDALASEERPVAEQVLRGGVPSVRQALDKQNEQARAEGRPTVPADSVVALAERLLPRLRAAEWRDRADAALSDLDDLDLRDLRSVVVAADTAAKDDESREKAAALRDGLARRVEQEQTNWLQELASTLAEGRVVRALRLSSRPPKAGARFPADLSERLSEAASDALTAEVSPERWATVLDAISLSPVRLTVTPRSRPDPPSEELLTTVRNLAGRVPQVAAGFGIEASAAPPPRRRRPRRPPAPDEPSPPAGPLPADQ
jgi:hypothetical protein